MKRQIPNIITLCNLTSGVAACYCALRVGLIQASMFVVLGIVFDFFDGLAARLLHVASPLGKELDSLADVVTSGVAPCFILFSLLSGDGLGLWLKWVALLMPAFSAYRLASFNLDERQHHSFIGLPAPANALIWVGMAIIYQSNTYGFSVMGSTGGKIALVALSLLTDLLLVSELPMFSLKFDFKDLGWGSNKIRYLFLATCAVLMLVFMQNSLPFLILWYIVLSICTQRKEERHD